MVNILKSRSPVAWVWGSERKLYWVNGCRCGSRKPGIRACGFGSGLSAGPARGELHLLSKEFHPCGSSCLGVYEGEGGDASETSGRASACCALAPGAGWVSSFPHRTQGALPFPFLVVEGGPGACAQCRIERGSVRCVSPESSSP